MTTSTEAEARCRDVDWSPLRTALEGAVIVPGDEQLLLANKQFAAGRPLLPLQALVRCRNTADVQRTLEFLVRHELPFSVRSGGHCFADLSTRAPVVVDLSENNRVEPQEGLAVIGPGALSAEVSRRLASVGRVVPTGGCPRVALGGLALVGGFGFLGRRHGLTTDQVERLEVVRADGSVVHASAGEAPDLYWALRGSGTAGFGIVTRLTLRTFPLEALTVVNGRWAPTEAAGLMELWQRHAPDAEDDVNLELGLVAPDDPELPTYVELFGVILGSEAGAANHLRAWERHLGPLASGLRTWRLPPAEAADYLVGLLDHETAPAWMPSLPYRHTGYQFTRSNFFDEPLAPESIQACVEQFQADRRYAQHRELELIPWGGAYARSNEGSSFIHRKARMMLRHTGTVGSRSSEALREHARGWVDASQATVRRHANGHVYQGYADLRLDDPHRAYYGDSLPRLRHLKHEYDPHDVFRHAQSLPPR
ncbi:FAD-binding oxidoreductase [Pyxidicoccus xibeiensis]|uniref:FAD-binding oxidoreductase n=1 Tax=Pyxidicoccus xibeiensis TaxID=2906759 RepID=UPI0020A76E2F|nr:FAD-binding oxidoreductase [Pyxidicoccus xibeiensis]MCP3142761.1 FAD-binding oxidoreductase [Pyxidicoccus xibeiensis]